MAKVTPVDIMNVEFRQAWRGYAPKEVDDFLAQVADAYSDAAREASKLREQVADLERRLAHYQESEGTLQRALTLAEKTSDEIRHAARGEAEVIVGESRAEGRRLAEAAREQVAEAAREVQVLREQRDRFEAELRGLLQTFSELLDRNREAAASRAVPAEGEADSAAT